MWILVAVLVIAQITTAALYLAGDDRRENDV